MIIGDNRKIASMIVRAHLEPKTGEMHMEHDDRKDEQDNEMDPDKEGLKAIAQEIMDAFHSRDVSALAMGLHDFFEMCDSSSDEEEKTSLLDPR